MIEYRASFDAEVTFLNGGGLQAQPLGRREEIDRRDRTSGIGDRRSQESLQVAQETPGPVLKAYDKTSKGMDLQYSLGGVVRDDGGISDVAPGAPYASSRSPVAVCGANRSYW